MSNDFGRALIDWYHLVKRDLPWRVTQDPYCIWLSEIMLQQTQVVTVIGYYNRFIKKYPTVNALAQANESEVYKLWEGLGYYSRARNLIRCAKEIVESYEGKFPQTVEGLKKLPGIGPYTAGAIASIAFNVKSHAVDGNVMRVISRIKMLEADVRNPKNRVVFESEVMRLMVDDSGDFNQGLMELGATICTPKSPKCHICPVQSFCMAYSSETQLNYPVKTPTPKKERLRMAVVILKHKGAYLMHLRPVGGLLSNLWGFPVVQVDGECQSPERLAREYLASDFGIQVKFDKETKGKTHIFTHLIWEMTLYHYDLIEMPDLIEDPEIAWVEPSAFSDYAIPTAFKKLLDLL